MCQQSWAEELTPYTSPSGRHDTARTGGKHASRKATHTSSLPCEHQRGGVGTPLVALRPASSSKLWKINAYQGGVAVCRSVPQGMWIDPFRQGYVPRCFRHGLLQAVFVDMMATNHTTARID